MLTLLPVALQLLAITNTSVVDPSTGTVRAGQTVVVRGSRIEAVTPARQARVPQGARRIDGTGRFVIPGLWDMHVHMDLPGGRAMLPLYVAHGVTGVRDMNSRLEVLRGWQQEIGRGAQVGPRMVVSGPYVVGRAVPLPHLVALTAAEGARAVDSLATLGVDFIKVHNALPPAALFGAARRARERGIVFAGHVFPPTTPLQASDSGQRSLEHLAGFPNECSAADSVRFARAHFLHRLLFGSCTSAPQGPVYAGIAKNPTWVTPTLVVQEPLIDFSPSVVPGDSVHKFFNDSLMAFIQVVMELPRDVPADQVALGQPLFDRRVAMTGALARAGVPMLVGTDAPLTRSMPGLAVHDELALLVKAGLTPAQALRSGTWEPARYLAATDSLGTVAPGKVADLVLLEANPLVNIANTRRIAGVVAGGRYFDRPQLNGLVAGARVRR